MNYPALIKAIGSASSQLQSRAAAAVNQALVLRNWLVGAWLVEYEQNGKDRAKYGARLLETLAADLAERDVKGLTEPRVLRECRALYSIYPQIRGTVSRELANSDDSVMDQKLFVSRYLVALPSAEKLRAFLEADRENIESLTPRPTAKKKATSKKKSLEKPGVLRKGKKV